MSDYSMNMEPMLEMYLFETNMLNEQLEEIMISSEKQRRFSPEATNEIFRIMHTIKGSSAMMMYNNIASLAHSLEDLFDFIRKNQDIRCDFQELSDLVLEVVDFNKQEIQKIQQGKNADGMPDTLAAKTRALLDQMKQQCGDLCVLPETNKQATQSVFYISSAQGAEPKEVTAAKYACRVQFEADCQMENVRAYMVVHNLKALAQELYHDPPDIISNNDTAAVIRENGIWLYFTTTSEPNLVEETILGTSFVQAAELASIDEYPDSLTALYPEVFGTKAVREGKDESDAARDTDITGGAIRQQSIISVNVAKLDVLMNIVGELVISEAMVTRNPDLEGLQLDNFSKAARQLRKLTKELQDVVMSVRMVPVATTFQKMKRLVRDMGRKLDKDVDLELLGEETEVDKNIIDNISDPLMHLIRNSMDHGLEDKEERLRTGKPAKGKITLEARNAGGDVWIFVRDDGRGLNREKILAKARDHGLVSKPDNELTDREIFSYILLPGFSTKENVSEFSGRGVGMDVVTRNIEKVGGTVSIASIPGAGTEIQIKIPLTLAIIDGMEIGVGKSKYTIPTTSIRESLRVSTEQIIADADGHEAIMIRGQCYPVIRISRVFRLQQAVEQIEAGIIVMVENDGQVACIFADELLGEQQVVVKPMPQYIRKVRGIAGCTILGDGSISLILDISGIIEMAVEGDE